MNKWILITISIAITIIFLLVTLHEDGFEHHPRHSAEEWWWHIK